MSSNGLVTALKTHPRLRDAAHAMLTRLATVNPIVPWESTDHPFIVNWSHLREVIEIAGDQLQHRHLGFGKSCSLAVLDRVYPSVVDVLHDLPMHNRTLCHLDLSTLKDESIHSNVI